MTEESEQNEEALSFVSLSLDGKRIMLNDKLQCAITLPLDLARKKYQETFEIVKTLIFNGCNSFNIFYVSDDNVNGCTKELVTQIYDRARAIKQEIRKSAAAAIGTETTIAEELEEQQQQQQPQEPPIELTEDITKEIGFKEIADILSSSIKYDEAAKIITFCGMLLAQTNEDQLNIGFQSESSTGKSYIPIEIANYFPKNEVEIIASASPTSFYHDGGKWDEERKVLIKDLEHKNLIFLDMAHFQLLEKLRPMLSKDMKELHYKITDKNQKFGLRTKNVVIRGFPSVFFCTTKTDPDEQEKTRMLLLSPSTDQEKLRKSLELVSLRRGNAREYNRRISQDPQRAWLTNRIKGIRQWGIREVIIPDDGRGVYDRFMKDHPYLMPRHQRDFPRIFSFIKAHALLNCFNREKKEEEDKPDTIMATQADIDAGYKLYAKIEKSNELGLSPYIYNIFNEVFLPILNKEKGLSRDDILRKHYEVRHKPLSPETLKREIIPQLETVGLISQQTDPDDKRKLLIYPTVSTPITFEGSASNQVSPIALDKLSVKNDDNSNSSQLPASERYRGQHSGVNQEPEEESKYIPGDSGYSDSSTPKEQIDNILKSLVEGNKDKEQTFSYNDFEYKLVMLPVQDPLRCNEDEAKQTFNQLLEEGKMTQIDTDKYKPNFQVEKKEHDNIK